MNTGTNKSGQKGDFLFVWWAFFFVFFLSGFGVAHLKQGREMMVS